MDEKMLEALRSVFKDVIGDEISSLKEGQAELKAQLSRFESDMNKQFETLSLMMAARFDNVEKQLNTLEKHVSNVDKSFHITYHELADVKSDVIRLKERIEN